LVPLFLALLRHLPGYIGRVGPQIEEFISAKKEGHAIKLKPGVEHENNSPDQSYFPQ
jgi:hypothetical protein